MKNLYLQLLEDNNIRQTLSAIRQDIKDSYNKDTFTKYVRDNKDVLIRCLSSEDAKTRKNCALLMADIVMPEFLEPLYMAYKRENTLFVKSSYLIAMFSYDYSMYLEDLKNELDALSHTELNDDNKKHVQEQIHALTKLIDAVCGTINHEFTGYLHEFDCILLTNRLHPDVTIDKIESGNIKPFSAGLKVHTDNLKELMYIRTYSDLFFVIPGMHSASPDVPSIVDSIIHSKLLTILTESHNFGAPFYFRIELKSKMPLDKKTAFLKKLSSEIEISSNRQFINSTSNYEVELRLIENKSGDYNMLVKLYTLPDYRFTYRINHVATSIRPVDAALLVSLSAEYMIPDARVLDPFCGVGTMLIERQMQVKANTSYGLDINADAIKGARENTESANQIVHYINKDFFRFTHEHEFDEIFTNMPFSSGHPDDPDIKTIYLNFFKSAKKNLTLDGHIIMYSHNSSYVAPLAKEYGYKILKHYTILDKQDTHLYILHV